MTDKNFQQALNAAHRIVESWPAWKQNSLLVTSMATNPAPRQPIIDAPERVTADRSEFAEASLAPSAETKKFSS